MSATSVLVPFSPTDEPHRARAWRWLEERWAAMDVELVTASGSGAEDTFNLPVGVNSAAGRATGDVFVIVEADVALEREWVEEAVAAVAEGSAPWALPRFYTQLQPGATARVLAGDPTGPLPEVKHVWRGDSICWCGGAVVRRDDFERVGGYDERFDGWGGPDIAFGLTMNALVGPVRRIEGSALHLWHPRGRLDRPTEDLMDLQRRYERAADDREAIAAVMEGKP